MDDAKLLQKLRDLEGLIAGADSDGERVAADQARERILERLRKLEQEAPPIEYKFSLPDPWSSRLLLALLRRYDLKPYRYKRQRRTTVMVRAPEAFVNEVLQPHFRSAAAELHKHLNEVAAHVIREAISADSDDAEEREESPQLPFGG